MKLTKRTYYAIQTHYQKKTFKSSTLGGVLDTLKAVGKILGDVSSGNIDPDQMSNELGEFIKSLSTTTEDDLTADDSNPLFIVVPELNAEGLYPAVGGVFYEFKMHVHDYKDKKNEKHKGSYEVTRRNIILTNGKIFNDIYKKVSK